MPALQDVARFTVHDLEEVVAFSFACPVCLRVDLDAAVRPVDHDGHAACACRRCGTAWDLGLDADQLLRLQLAPPARERWRLRLRFAGGGAGGA